MYVCVKFPMFDSFGIKFLKLFEKRRCFVRASDDTKSRNVAAQITPKEAKIFKNRFISRLDESPRCPFIFR